MISRIDIEAMDDVEGRGADRPTRRPAAKKTKLTKAQQHVMDLISEHGHFRCIDAYGPAKKLIELSLVEAKTEGFGAIRLTKKD